MYERMSVIRRYLNMSIFDWWHTFHLCTIFSVRTQTTSARSRRKLICPRAYISNKTSNSQCKKASGWRGSECSWMGDLSQSRGSLSHTFVGARNRAVSAIIVCLLSIFPLDVDHRSVWIQEVLQHACSAVHWIGSVLSDAHQFRSKQYRHRDPRRFYFFFGYIVTRFVV